MISDGTCQTSDAIIIQSPCLIWLPQGTKSSITVHAGGMGNVISIPEVSLGAALPAGALGNEVRLALGKVNISKNIDPKTLSRLHSLASNISEELYANQPASQSLVRYSLTLLMIEIWRISEPELTTNKSFPRTIYQNFNSLLDLHLTDHWTVETYAKHIGVSKDRLTSVIQRATGRTPLSEIHHKMIQEAEELLINSTYQISEIAFKLGYKDAAYFNRFFKRITGKSPGKFRAEFQRLELDNSFASWP
ncbi:helix-turn-helix domain-containing protein [Sneathiella sp. P13V-1]|uniref:helix-turn-helix domain-containing protein n=1 Tax=Sneathiella sp. P13V-1 TaxID=2697366 RepID=UPI00187B9379|nr:helix-turn-helix domain-containing protein [Sneathiella sp. P13V-1]MBE7637481.1 helix-turn-helix domain-containing protein [Sneathiella sp. P13V-1]